MSQQFRKLKVAVVREELKAITGNFFKALLLGQFMYWSERVRDASAFLQEEKLRGAEFETSLEHGWFFKSIDSLLEETMLDVTDRTVSKYVSELEQEGFLFSRDNPFTKWDRTRQYRVNMLAIHKALHEKGYHVDGYIFVSDRSEPVSHPCEDFSSRSEMVSDRSEPVSLHYQRLNTQTIKKTTQQSAVVPVRQEIQQEKLYTFDLHEQHVGTLISPKDFTILKDLAELWPRRAVEVAFVHLGEQKGKGGFGPALVRHILTTWHTSGQFDQEVERLENKHRLTMQIKAELLAKQKNDHQVETHIEQIAAPDQVDRVKKAWESITAKQLEKIRAFTDRKLTLKGSPRYAHFFDDLPSYLRHYYPKHILLHHPESPFKSILYADKFVTFEQAAKLHSSERQAA